MAVLRYAVDIPNLQRMRDAVSSNDLWRSISNDEVHRLQVWMHEASGKWATLMSDHSPETWQTAQATIRALEGAVLSINYLLGVVPLADPGDVRVLEAWFSKATSSTFPQEGKIALSILQSLGLEIIGFGSGKERAGGRELNELAVLRSEKPYSLRWPSRTFDVFVSYKHLRDGERAATLADSLGALGLECWLDQVQLRLDPGSVVVDLLLKRWLREALTASRCTVFFETALEATADEDFRGKRVAFNWQVYEQRYARNIVYIRPTRGELYFDDGTTLNWSTVPELARLVAEHVHGLPPVDLPDAQPLHEQADLARAVADLRRYGHDYSPAFRTATPLASLALLAPRTIDAGVGEGGPGADDVLLALARYDPRSAMMLQSAGIDLHALFAAGSKILQGRWSDPSRYRWADVLGQDGGAHQLAAVFTETDLLKGLARGVLSGTGEARRLLEVTLRYVHRTWAQDEIDQAVQRAAEQLIAGSSENENAVACRHGRHGWIILKTTDALRAVPVARYGVFRLAADCRSLPQEVAIYIRQARYLFPGHVVAEVDENLNSTVAQDSFDELIERRPEFAVTFTGTPAPCTVHILTATDDDVALLALDASEIRIGTCAPEPSPPPHGADLIRALTRLESSGNSPLESRWPIETAPRLHGALISEPCMLLAAEPELSEFELLAKIVSPLRRYQHLRELEYDDF